MTDQEENPKTNADAVAKWLTEITYAMKREKNFRSEGQRIVSIYEAEKVEEYQFNILFSNTETLAPALYNSTPRPVVQRRFKDEDPLGKAASAATQRILEYALDTGEREYSPFDDLMKSAVLEALLPGRGVSKFKYDADGDYDDEKVLTKVKTEAVCGEEVPWDRFLHGYAKKWKDVPWCAYLHIMTKEEVSDNFSEAIAAKVEYTAPKNDSDERQNNEGSREETAGVSVAYIYEIWDKETKKVLFVSDSYKDDYLKPPIDDPLKLSGFFPSPKPLTLIQKISTLVPVAPYKLYEAQAKELNLVTQRINKITAALKVRGMYDNAVEGMANVLTADDNVLQPVDNVAALQSNGATLEKAIWLMPIEKLITVLQQLYINRDQIKQVIYEITGIADIMRGASNASETLGAQEIKNQWGTLRLKRTQKEVMRYTRDCLRIIAEISVTKLNEQTLKAMTGLPYPTGMEQQQAQQVVQQFQAKGQEVAMQAQMAGQEPPPPPPEALQAMQQAQQVVQGPGWPAILNLLRDDTLRSFRVDIETNSTVDAEATEDKQNVGELLNAMAQFLNGITPLIENGSMPFEVAMQMLQTIIRRFRFGPELEDMLKNMKAPPPKPPDPKVEIEKTKAQTEMQKGQMELQKMQAAAVIDKARMQAQASLDERKQQMEERKMAMEMEFMEAEHALKMRELQAKAADRQQQHQQQMESTVVGAAVQSEGLQQKGEFQRQTHEQRQKDLKAKANQPKPAKAK